MDKLAFRAINRFAAFLSLYIHSLNYEWNWEMYHPRSTQSRLGTKTLAAQEEEKKAHEESVKQRYFFRALVSSLQNLSLADRLVSTLPKELHRFVVKTAAPFKYSSPEEMGHADAQIIIDRIKEKATAEQLTALINSPASHIESSGDLLFDIILRSIFSLAQ